MQNQDPPTIAEELARKSVDELTRLGELVMAGRLTKGEFSLCAKTVWAIASGLVDRETSLLIEQAANEYPTPTRRVSFFNPTLGVYTFLWDPEKDDYYLISVKNDKRMHIKVGRDERAESLKNHFDRLEKSGWKQV